MPRSRAGPTAPSTHDHALLSARLMSARRRCPATGTARRLSMFRGGHWPVLVQNRSTVYRGGERKKLRTCMACVYVSMLGHFGWISVWPFCLNNHGTMKTTRCIFSVLNFKDQSIEFFCVSCHLEAPVRKRRGGSPWLHDPVRLAETDRKIIMFCLNCYERKYYSN